MIIFEILSWILCW